MNCNTTHYRANSSSVPGDPTPGTDFDRLAAGATQTVQISYVIRDENNAESTGTLSITVTGRNDAPVAVLDTATTDENTTITVDALANDTDVDNGAVLSLVSVSVPAGKGNATIVNGKVRFLPGTAFDHLAAGQSEVVQITYVMRDQAGAESTNKVRVTVTGTNDGPVAVADTGATTENASVTVNVRANDTDADDGAVLTLVSASVPTGKGSVTFSGPNITFNPGSDFDRLAAGATEVVTVTYVVRDENNATATSTLKITVTGTNDAPIAVADTAATTENAGITLSPLANDTDVDNGTTLTLVSATVPAGKGSVTLVGNQVQFAPGTAFDGLKAGATEVVTITYVVRDNANAESTGTMAVTVTGTNDAPIVTADAASVDENRSVTFAPLANDSDVDTGAVLRVANLVVPEGKGSAVFVGNQIRYSAGTDFDRLPPGGSQTVRITYDVIDETGAVTPSFAIITVNGTNDLPILRADKIKGREDTVTTFSVDELLANDSDADRFQTLTVTSVRNGANGTVSLADGIITFTPNPDHFGKANFYYTVSDGAGGVAEAKVTMQVRAVDDLAIVRDDAFAIDEDAVLQGNVLIDNGNGPDTDIDSEMVIGAVNGVATSVGKTITLASGATVRVNSTGKFTYQTNGAFDDLTGVSGATNSSATDSFTYRLVDGTVGTVTLNIAGLSDSNAPALGGAGNDTLIGTAAGETIKGGRGADLITPGGGADILVYDDALDSPGTGYDVVTGFAFTEDRIDVSGVRADYHRDADVTNATLRSTAFDRDLRVALTGVLNADGVSLVTATGGGLAGHSYLVIDQNGTAGYQAGEDLVLELVSPTGLPAAGVDFLM